MDIVEKVLNGFIKDMLVYLEYFLIFDYLFEFEDDI